MPVSGTEFEFLSSLFHASEDEIRRTIDPYFTTAFHAISLQSHRLTYTIASLVSVRGNLCAASDNLLVSIQTFRVANPNKRTRGTQHLRRVFSNKNLLKDCDKENVDPRIYYEDEEENFEDNVKVARNDKILFERADYGLRHKLEGIKVLMDIVDDRIDQLSMRKAMCESLEKIGVKWGNGTFEAYDVERIASAEGEVVEGSVEMREVWGMLDVLVKRDFTLLSGGKNAATSKRMLEIEWESDGEGMKRKHKRAKGRAKRYHAR